MLEYQLTGIPTSACILLLHGLGANRTQFEQQQLYFQQHYKVLLVDLPGHGAAAKLASNSAHSYTLSDLAQQLIQLLDHLSIERVHFVGNSMGGNIGFELLRMAPERLHSLCTFGTTAELHKSTLEVWFIRLIYKLFSQKTLAKLAKAAGHHPTSKTKITEMLMMASKPVMLALMEELVNFDYTQLLQHSTLPSLLIQGEQDTEINKVLSSTLAAHQHNPHFQLQIMSGVGHFANLDDPETFNQILKTFIEGK